MKRTIFVVEDHPLMRQSLLKAIEREADLTVCGHAEDAPDALSGILSIRPDIVLTDIQLKSSSGLDLIRAIRALDPWLPIVATTLFDIQRTEGQARAAGASDFVSKQEGPERLISVMRKSLAERRSQAEQEQPEDG